MNGFLWAWVAILIATFLAYLWVGFRNPSIRKSMVDIVLFKDFHGSKFRKSHPRYQLFGLFLFIMAGLFILVFANVAAR